MDPYLYELPWIISHVGSLVGINMDCAVCGVNLFGSPESQLSEKRIFQIINSSTTLLYYRINALIKFRQS